MIVVAVVVVGIATLVIAIRNTIITKIIISTSSSISMVHCAGFRISSEIGSFSNIKSAAICCIFWIDCLSVNADCCV